MDNNCKSQPDSTQDEQRENTQVTQDKTNVCSTPSDLSQQVLVIYRTRPDEEGDYWTTEYGNVNIPEGWEFLPRGNTYITRQVKKGPHWILKGRYNRKGGYTPIKGVYAPSAAIKAAVATNEATEAKREQARLKARPRREKAEARYHQEFEEACLRFLDFAPAYRDLSCEIASETAAWACEKSSGRVGRISLMGLEDKAALGVRAYIRHRYTDYETNLPDFNDYYADEAYRQAKKDAQLEVDRFLEEHRA